MQQQILKFVTRKSNLTLHEWNRAPHNWAGSCCLNVAHLCRAQPRQWNGTNHTWPHANAMKKVTCPHHDGKYRVQILSFHISVLLTCLGVFCFYVHELGADSWITDKRLFMTLLQTFSSLKPGRLKLLTCDLRDKNNLASVREKWKKEKGPYSWGRVAISARFRG